MEVVRVVGRGVPGREEVRPVAGLQVAGRGEVNREVTLVVWEISVI